MYDDIVYRNQVELDKPIHLFLAGGAGTGNKKLP